MSWTLYKDFILDTLKSKTVLGTDSSGKVIDGVTGADARYLKLDQSTPQTLTATDVTITASDEIYYGDVTDSTKVKKDTIQGILDLVPAPDLSAYLKLDQSSAQTITASPVLNWGTSTRVPYYDANKKLTDSAYFTFGTTAGLDVASQVSTISGGTVSGTADFEFDYDYYDGAFSAWSSWQFRIYGYKETTRGRVYSSNYLETDFKYAYPPPYYYYADITISWTENPAYDGYLLVIWGYDLESDFDKAIDVGAVTSFLLDTTNLAVLPDMPTSVDATAAQSELIAHTIASKDGLDLWFRNNTYFFGTLRFTDSIRDNISTISGSGIVSFGGGTASGTKAISMGSGTASGTNSFCVGEGGTASGLNSAHFGKEGTVSGESSFCSGEGHTVTGPWSAAFGMGNTVGGTGSSFAFGGSHGITHSGCVAFGYSGKCQGFYAAHFGSQGTASDNYATHFGLSGNATGSGSTHFGNGGTASGANSVHFGQYGMASGAYATHFGLFGTASGTNAVHFGERNLADSWGLVTLGRFSVASGGTTTSWVDADPIVIFGNGTSTSARSNSAIIYKNGKARFSEMSPMVTDGGSLGTTTYMWSDLFLASGAVINFNNGNVTLTHSAGQLTLAGDLQITAKVGFYDTTPVTQPTGVAAQKVNYTAGDLDTEAEIITALNATNTAINTLRTALNALGLTTTV
jgi:hypothetical protein